MPTLFVANTTKQRHVFLWKRPEMQNYARNTIEAGQQIRITDLSTEDIDAIVQHHSLYGLKDARQLSRRKGFTGLCYSVDEEVKIDEMLATYDLNDHELARAAERRRRQEAAAISDNMASALNQMTGIDKEKLRPKTLETQVREVTDGTPAINEGTEVPSDPKGKLKNAPRT